MEPEKLPETGPAYDLGNLQAELKTALATKHLRFSPVVGEVVRVNGGDPSALHTVESFKTKGKRTTIAVLHSEAGGYMEVAVSNLAPPLKRTPKVEPTKQQVAAELFTLAHTEPTKRNFEKAALAQLRAVTPEAHSACKPIPKFICAILRFLGYCVDPEPINRTALACAVLCAERAE